MPLELNVMLSRSALSTVRQKTICVTSTCVYTRPHLMEGKSSCEAEQSNMLLVSVGLLDLHRNTQGSKGCIY